MIKLIYVAFLCISCYFMLLFYAFHVDLKYSLRADTEYSLFGVSTVWLEYSTFATDGAFSGWAGEIYF